MIPCDSQAAIPKLVMSIVVAIVAMYTELMSASLVKKTFPTTSFRYNNYTVESIRFCKFGVGGVSNS